MNTNGHGLGVRKLREAIHEFSEGNRNVLDVIIEAGELLRIKLLKPAESMMMHRLFDGWPATAC